MSTTDTQFISDFRSVKHSARSNSSVSDRGVRDGRLSRLMSSVSMPLSDISPEALDMPQSRSMSREKEIVDGKWTGQYKNDETWNENGKMGVSEEKKVQWSVAKIGTAKLLKGAWNVGTIASTFGLSLLWADVHVFLAMFMPDRFCRLGEEWIPDQMRERLTEDQFRSACIAPNIIEKFLLSIFNGVLIVIIMLFLSILGFLGYVRESYGQAAWNFAGPLFEMLRKAIW